tara:strand:+ start:2027 stop:2347 length:321 start_codon:yes stop_codon:yes gene_type:complete
MEKDCTDDLMECTTECDTHDKECHADCIEEYHDCEIVPHLYEETLPLNDMNVDEDMVIAELLTLTKLLNGKCTRTETLDSTGRSSKRIVIEYDIRTKGTPTASQET